MQNLRKVVSWLKPGGTLLLVLVLNIGYYMLSGVKYHLPNLSLEFVLKCFSEVGLTDVRYKVYPYPAIEGKVNDHKYVFFSAVY